jgi:hypothetical protein
LVTGDPVNRTESDLLVTYSAWQARVAAQIDVGPPVPAAGTGLQPRSQRADSNVSTAWTRPLEGATPSLGFDLSKSDVCTTRPEQSLFKVLNACSLWGSHVELSPISQLSRS